MKVQDIDYIYMWRSLPVGSTLMHYEQVWSDCDQDIFLHEAELFIFSDPIWTTSLLPNSLWLPPPHYSSQPGAWFWTWAVILPDSSGAQMFHFLLFCVTFPTGHVQWVNILWRVCEITQYWWSSTKWFDTTNSFLCQGVDEAARVCPAAGCRQVLISMCHVNPRCQWSESLQGQRSAWDVWPSED